LERRRGCHWTEKAEEELMWSFDKNETMGKDKMKRCIEKRLKKKNRQICEQCHTTCSVRLFTNGREIRFGFCVRSRMESSF
jgi:hypothetical protein